MLDQSIYFDTISDADDAPRVAKVKLAKSVDQPSLLPKSQID